jgi:hypothetical protein
MKHGVHNRGLGLRPSSLLDDEDPLREKPIYIAERSGPRRWPKLVLGGAVILLVLIGLLPRILSLSPCRTLILKKVNTALAPATLSVDDWSLRWFGGMAFVGLRFSDAERGVEAQVVKINSSGGLVGVLPGSPLNLHTITVEAPEVTVRLARAQPAWQGTAAGTGTSGGGDPDVTPDESPVAVKPPTVATAGRLRPLCGKLVVQGGRLEVAGAGATPFVLEHLAVQADVQSLASPVVLKLAAFVPWKDDAGVISLEGTLPSLNALLVAGAPVMEEQLRLGVKQLDLQGFRALLEALTGQPWVRGVMANGSVQLTYRGREDLHLVADLAVAQLSVEPPGKPVSPPGDLRVQADCWYDDERIKIDQLICSSPWLALQGSGQFRLAPDANGRRIGDLIARAEVDLQALTRDFGSLLQLRDDFRVERGWLRLDAAVNGTAEALEIRGDLVTSNLALRSQAELFVLQPAPRIKLDVSLPYEQPVAVRELLVELPFARLTGKGRMDQGAARLNLDLAAFTKDFRRVLTNCPTLTGTLQADWQSRPDGDRVAMELAANIAGVRAEWLGRAVALNQASLQVTGRVPLWHGLPLPDVADLKVTGTGEAGSIQGSAARIVIASNQPLVLVDGQCRAELDVAAVRRLAGAFLPALPVDAAVAGKLVSAISLGMQQGQTKVRMNTVLQDARLLTTAWDVREEDVRLKLSLDTDWGKGALRIFDTRLVSQCLTLDVPEWQVQRPLAGQPLVMKGDARGEANLAVLSAWQRAGKSGAPPQIEGKWTFQAQGVQDPQQVAVTAQTTLDGFRYAATNSVPFVEPHAELALKALLPVDGRNMQVESLSIKSSLVDLDAKGEVESPFLRPGVNVTGNAGLNYNNINLLLRARGFTAPVLAGQKLRPFALRGPLDGGLTSLLALGKGNITSYLESAAAFGLVAAPADARATLADGVVQVDYQPTLNQGKFICTPSLEVTRVPMLLTLPPKTRLLQNVQLTQEMLDEGLTLLLPLLHGSTVLGGTVDLTFQECQVPLGPSMTNDMTFRAALTLHNLRLVPAGTLAKILGIAGHSGREISIAQYEITAECQRGLVKPSDLVFQLAGTQITLAGTVGLNGALAYTAVVPLSRDLVGKELARFLDGAVLTVPITGTIRAPAIDRKAVDGEVKRLLNDAMRQGAGDALGGLLQDLKKKKKK